MKNTYRSNGNLALSTKAYTPDLHVIPTRTNRVKEAYDELSYQVFGNLYATSTSTCVQDILDGKTKIPFLANKGERAFACVACAIAVAALFVFSFVNF